MARAELGREHARLSQSSAHPSPEAKPRIEPSRRAEIGTRCVYPWRDARLAAANPLTYQVDALRADVACRRGHFGLALDAAVLLGTLALRTAVAARLYPRMVT